MFRRQTVAFAGSCVLQTINGRAALRYPSDFIEKSRIPEIAFAGESNVGKSSLIEALLDYPNLVKTSRRPGSTQHLNYFLLGPNRLSLVDMPGYGRASREEWGKLITQYLTERRSLRRVYLLVDAQRRVRTRDKQVIDILTELGIPFSVILTKLDGFPVELRPFIGTVVQNMEQWITQNGGPCCWPSVIATSAKAGTGLTALRTDILEKCGLPTN